MEERIVCEVCRADLALPEGMEGVICPFCGAICWRGGQEPPGWDDGLPFPPLPGFEDKRRAAPVREIADSWEEIFAAIADGTYEERYEIGDVKALDLGPEGVVYMQIAAFGADDLTEGAGKAPITWISRELLGTRRRMNPPAMGAIGGWSKSELRAWMNQELTALIPEEVRGHICTVVKGQEAVDSDGRECWQATRDRLWIPSFEEIREYAKLFLDMNYIEKMRADGTNGSWWLRSAYDAGAYSAVRGDGRSFAVEAEECCGVCLGFCTK